MKKKFEILPPSELLETRSVEMIDYSILLAKVFGQPVDTAKAFMYIFRRYGYSPYGCDDLKDLCRYLFNTNDDEINVQWRMTEGEYHHHLCAFTTAEIGNECYKEDRLPYTLWYERAKLWMKETHNYEYYTMFEVFKPDADKIKMDFVGTPEQEAEILDFLKQNCNGEFTNESWFTIDKWKRENNDKYRKEYESIESFPTKGRDVDFWECRNNPLKAAEKQHTWIESLSKDSPIKRVYFAAMALFEDWKRPTNIRDVDFNLLGEESESNPFTQRECIDDEIDESEPTPQYISDDAGYSNSAGYGVPEALFEGDNFNTITELLK